MAIQNTNFLSQLTEEQCADLFDITTVRTYNHKELLYKSDTDSNHVFIITSGRIKIYQLSDKGKETILWFLFKGDIFGLAELHRTYDINIYAESYKNSEIMVIPHNKFLDFLAKFPSVSLFLIKLLSQRLRLLAEMLLNLSSDDVTTRLIKFLKTYSMQYGELSGEQVTLSVKLTHQEIGDMIGASRQTVSSSFSRLQQSGLIDKRSGTLVINKNKLHDYTNQTNYEH